MRDIRGPVLQNLNNQFADLNLSCFKEFIPENALFEEAIKSHTSVVLADPISSPALAYWKFYIELMQKIDGTGIERAEQKYAALQQAHRQRQEEEKQRRLTAKQASLTKE